MKIIYDDANCKTTIDIKKSNVDSYDIIDETNKRAFSLWKTLLLGTTFLNGLVLFNESNGVQGVQTRLKRKDRFESK